MARSRCHNVERRDTTNVLYCPGIRRRVTADEIFGRVSTEINTKILIRAWPHEIARDGNPGCWTYERISTTTNVQRNAGLHAVEMDIITIDRVAADCPPQAGVDLDAGILIREY